MAEARARLGAEPVVKAVADPAFAPPFAPQLNGGFGVEIPFVNHLGFELKRFDGGCSELHYTPQPAHLNSFAVTHGGALMTLLDVAMAVAARSMAPALGVVTIEMKTSFMQPATGALIGKGHLMHRSTHMAFTQATVFDEAGRACAHATGTFKYVKRAPASASASAHTATD